MRTASTPFMFIAMFTASVIGGCTVNSSDGSGGGDDGDGGGDVGNNICVSTNETDVGQCDLDCDVAVEGEAGIFECTVSCNADTDCATGSECVTLNDGSGACLESCNTDSDCDANDTCDIDLSVCLPGEASTSDGVCETSIESDIASCDEDCDAAVAGDGDLSRCTISCSSTDDCAEGLECTELADGSGACLEPCVTNDECGDSGDYCDGVALVCLPGERPTTDGECTIDTVADADTCDADCDNPVEGDDGVFMCTASCDVDTQNCGSDEYYCYDLGNGTGACVYDCSGGNSCPSDYVCDQELTICIPVSVSE